MSTKHFKPFIGQDIYLLPTGNNVRRSTPLTDQVQVRKLIKVGRTNLTTELAGTYNYQGKLDRHNAGYIHFCTKEDVDNYFKSNELRTYFADLFRYHSDNLSYDQLSRMYNITKEQI